MKLVNPGKIPAVWVSLIPFAFLAATLSIVIKIFGGSALDGASQVSLLLASGVVVAISMIFYKVKWEDFENGIMDNIRSVSSAILILFLIGAVAGTWMASGIVPMMIYYGMKIITPKIFLFATCAICALISVMTGSSWTTIATVGVALIGIGAVHGYSAGWTAGAIISGAYFGDKISPLSDTTTLASSAAGTPLFTHIRYMLLTTIPSFVIALIIFLAVSLTHETSSQSTIAEFAGDLASCFNINLWLFLVPVITGVLIVRKMPAILTLFVAILLAAAAALIFQPHIVWHIASGEPLSAYRHLSFMDGFKGLMLTTYGSTGISVGNPALDRLIATNGITGMLPSHQCASEGHKPHAQHCRVHYRNRNLRQHDNRRPVPLDNPYRQPLQEPLQGERAGTASAQPFGRRLRHRLLRPHSMELLRNDPGHGAEGRDARLPALLFFQPPLPADVHSRGSNRLQDLQKGQRKGKRTEN